MKRIYLLLLFLLWGVAIMFLQTMIRELIFQYKTFAYFKPGIDKVEISDLDKRRILKAIDLQMAQKSMMKSDLPDLVSINTTAKKRFT